jgi:ADP-ribosyl-[dinitrogen reductase] hydrolase
MKNTLLNKITGALLGLAVGDALGAPAEFHNQKFVKATWGTLTEMVGGGVWNPGEWTDDTGMALCIAEAILEKPESPVEGAGKRFLEWRKTTKDCGNTIASALYNFNVCRNWSMASRNTTQAKSGKAAGNGGLMRTLPVALAYADPTEMWQRAAELSAMTHWDCEAEACAIIYCRMIANILDGQQISDAWHDAVITMFICYENNPAEQTHPGTQNLSAAFWERLSEVSDLTYEELQPSGYAGYCVENLEASVWCCLHSESYEDAMIKCVNLAGEADTIAAVAGGIAGAFYGLDAIPTRWLEALYKRDDLEQTAQKLASLRCGSVLEWTDNPDAQEGEAVAYTGPNAEESLFVIVPHFDDEGARTGVFELMGRAPGIPGGFAPVGDYATVELAKAGVNSTAVTKDLLGV